MKTSYYAVIFIVILSGSTICETTRNSSWEDIYDYSESVSNGVRFDWNIHFVLVNNSSPNVFAVESIVATLGKNSGIKVTIRINIFKFLTLIINSCKEIVKYIL